MESLENNIETATLGAGCFWCVEAIFQKLKGVQSVTSGYSGGKIKNPAYREVCSGLSGHAEVIQIKFDPKAISFHDLLVVFFNSHDPTALNRQGADSGTQYRSVIFYHNDDQKKVAQDMIRTFDSQGSFDSKIVTEVSPFTEFYVAEDYHQNYFNANGDAPYCQFVIAPKLGKFIKNNPEKIQE